MPLTEGEVKEILDILEKGGVIAIPTDTVYGLAVDAFNKDAIEKIYKIKGRDKTKPLVLFVSDRKEVEKFAYIDIRAEKIMDRFWPGGLTIILKAKEDFVGKLPMKEGKISFRIPDHPDVLTILERAEFPLATTSANPSGMEPLLYKNEVENEFGEKIDLIVDGLSKLKKASMVIDLSEEVPLILRKGPISILELETEAGEYTKLKEGISLNILFVCTGNSCRSPMAEYILRHTLREKGFDSILVKSAGMIAYDRTGMMPEAERVLTELSIDAEGHRSRPLTRDLIEDFDIIYCMEQIHLHRVEELSTCRKAILLGGEKWGEIPDPIGRDTEFYRKVRDIIKSSIEEYVLPYIEYKFSR